MAKQNNSAKKKTNRSKTGSTKTNSKNSNNNYKYTDGQRRVIILLSIAFIAVFMALVVFIEAGGLWGYFRNFFFGVFGISAFVLPFFIILLCIMSAINKNTREFKARVIEILVVYILIISLCHVVSVDSTLSYGKQIASAYNVFKEYSGSGMHYGYGVAGALLGGVSLLITAGSKLASGAILILLILALGIFFWGPKIVLLISSLKKPAEATAAYAGEKAAEIHESYETISESLSEKRAKNAEKRRSKNKKREIELDIPIDDEIPEDNGIEPLLETPEEIELLPDFEDTAVFAPPLDELLNNQKKQAVEETPVADADVEDVKPVNDTFVNTNGFEVDTETGEIIEEVEEPLKEDVTESVVEIDDIPQKQYELPPLDCLKLPKADGSRNNTNEIHQRGEIIVNTLKSFGVGTKIVDICQSPSVTRFELRPDPGVKISRIAALSDDIAMNLAASGVRIEAPIPNKNAVGIEVPNEEKTMVTLREILDTPTYQKAKSKLNVALGRDIQGAPTCADLAKMPHLLVAGTTGSGKSVCLNTMIISLLYNATPEEVKLIMIDPKKVEFTVYRSLPHLLVPVVSDPRKAAGALSWAVAEMDKRYALFADNGVRNLEGYNNFAVAEGLPKMPQIVIIIDELADLMMAASNEVEDSICRLAQKARAAGMHLIVATQRPSVDVITGLIKANIPSRIAFAVKSSVDSRTIIDTQGAEKLLGNGDMLYCPVGLSKPVRVQGSYVSDDEISNVIDFITSQGDVKYDDEVMREIELKAAQEGKKKNVVSDDRDMPSGDYEDEVFPKAVEVVVEAGMASTTLLQRKLKLGYARAARVMDELEDKGIVGPHEGSKPRKVLITKEQWYQMQATSQSTVPKQLSVDDISVNEPEAHTENTNISNSNYFGSAVNNSDYNVEDE